MILVKRFPIFLDDYIASAIANLFGFSLCTGILFNLIGWICLIFAIPVLIYLSVTSFSLAFFRLYIIFKINDIATIIEKIINQITFTDNKNHQKPRKLYTRRIELLYKSYAVHFKTYLLMIASLDALRNMGPDAFYRSTDLLVEAQRIIKTKIFLDK